MSCEMSCERKFHLPFDWQMFWLFVVFTAIIGGILLLYLTNNHRPTATETETDVAGVRQRRLERFQSQPPPLEKSLNLTEDDAEAQLQQEQSLNATEDSAATQLQPLAQQDTTKAGVLPSVV